MKIFINMMSLVLYCGLIFWLSSQPSLPAPQFFLHQDKLHHMGAYFIMATLAWNFFKGFIDSPTILTFVSISYCSLYGISDEWHQSFVAGREADIYDWLADTMGAVLALMFIYLIKKKLTRYSQ